ncbi:Innexin [Ancylostoma ceylanicum]|uniref:Innexin n=1 Tax=Ancylostoma ceylanicum TaxID=53326 RepID=A0A0D6MCD9_9BILA|nr:Innexin [Ancylostoma ceylanicum]
MDPQPTLRPEVKEGGGRSGGARISAASRVPRMVFAEIVGTLSFLHPQADDDISDRLHYYYTTTFLLLTAVLVSIKMFGGRPIECWLPAEYKSSWEDYTEMYCWARNTYFAPFEDEFLPEVPDRGKSMTRKAAIAAATQLQTHSTSIRLNDIMNFANDKSNVQPASRRANINGLAMHLSSVFKHRFRFGSSHPYHHRVFKFLNLRFYEAYLTFLYLGIKLLFLINVLVQMILLSRFLQTNSQGFYGYGILWDLVTGQGWTESPNFPVITYCDMEIRILGNIQRHTVQFIARRLELADVTFKQRDFTLELDEFVRDYVKMDGIFVLRMITIHSGVLICTEVVDTMWDQFLAEQASRDEYKEERSPSAGGQSMEAPLRRKTSVLVPLMSREDLTQISDHGMLRPPSRM